MWVGTSEAQSLSPDKNRLAIAIALSVKNKSVKRKYEFQELKQLGIFQCVELQR